jgi:hypothetical protein
VTKIPQFLREELEQLTRNSSELLDIWLWVEEVEKLYEHFQVVELKDQSEKSTNVNLPRCVSQIKYEATTILSFMTEILEELVLESKIYSGASLMKMRVNIRSEAKKKAKKIMDI